MDWRRGATYSLQLIGSSQSRPLVSSFSKKTEETKNLSLERNNLKAGKVSVAKEGLGRVEREKNREKNIESVSNARVIVDRLAGTETES